MTKILYIITQSEWGGAQRYVFDLAINLQKSQGHEITVATGGNGQLFDRLEAKKLTTVRLKHLVRSISPMADLRAYFEIKKLLHHTNPDIVHLNSSKVGLLGSLAAARVGIKKIIYTAHGFVFNEPLPFWKKWLYKKIELASSKHVNKIITVSDYDRRTGIKAGINPYKLITIHNGIDPKINFLTKNEARTKFFNTPIHPFTHSPLIGCIANFYPTKGLDILIQAMKNIDASLVIIGEGREEKKLKLQVISYKLQEKIFFLGHVDNASQYLKAFDLFVLPSRKEGLSYTLLEAVAAGVPIVATAVGGTPEVITDRVNGYLAEPENINDLTDKIKQTLAKPLAPPTFVFTLDKMIAATAAIYESA